MIKFEYNNWKVFVFVYWNAITVRVDNLTVAFEACTRDMQKRITMELDDRGIALPRAVIERMESELGRLIHD